jgi:hypothetical protein
MRRIAAILFFFISVSTTEFVQVLKLPWLISHFIEHFKEGQDVYAFMHEHYVHHHGSNSDQDEDNQLPFKTTSIQQTNLTYLLPPIGAITKPAVILHKNKLILPDIVLPSDFLKDIFHPPRIV